MMCNPIVHNLPGADDATGDESPDGANHGSPDHWEVGEPAHSQPLVPSGVPIETVKRAYGYLVKAWSLIDSGYWTRHHVARDSAGVECHPLDDRAVRWSIGGALVKAYGHRRPIEHWSPEDIAWLVLRNTVRAQTGNRTIMWFNDEMAADSKDAARMLDLAVDLIAAEIRRREAP